MAEKRYFFPENGDLRQVVDYVTIELRRGLFTDTVRVWSGSPDRWPGFLFGGMSIRECRHRYGPTLFAVIVETMIAVVRHLPEPPYVPLPTSRRGLNRLLAAMTMTECLGCDPDRPTRHRHAALGVE